ncbi:MAG: serine/threonine-protein kinase [Thermoanaerobaculia bacterium]
MTNPRFARLSQLLDEALDLPPAARRDFLNQAAGDDPALLAAALAAISDEDSSAHELRHGIAAAIEHGRSDSRATLRCGPWRLLRSIGKGGMGEVYLAERADGAFEQEVAVKVLASSVPGRELATRLERERQILARLEHPNIARLIDGGLADDGSPYFALEYVVGEPMNDYFRSRNLPLTDRLQIFLQICDAVAFAHARLVVHRDIKPANVLVTTQGQAKLLDFGIAKLIEEDDLGLTRSVDRLLTPRYASPEQLAGQPATTATDVHALGLLLFELLTGVPPFGAEATSVAAIAREIAEKEAPRPSSLAATRRPTDRERDLDEICGRALRKRPEDRYASVAALAADVRRSLAGFPVEARAGARLYRARKFASRHRVALAGASLAFLGLAAGFLVALLQRDRARASEARAKSVERFLIDDLLLASTPEEAKGRKPLVAEALTSASRRISSALSRQPEVEYHVRGVLGEAFLRLGEFDLAEEQIAREQALSHEITLTPDAASSADMRRLKLLLARGENRAAAQLASELESRLEKSSPLSENRWLAEAYRGLAGQRLGDFSGAEAQMRAAERGLGALEGAGRSRLEVLSLLLGNLSLQRKYVAAEPAAKRLVEETAARLGPDHPDLVRALDTWAQALRRLRHRREAQRIAEQSVALGDRILGPAHLATINARLTLAFVLWDLRDFKAAEEVGEKLLPLARSGLGPDHPTTARVEELVAILLSARGEFPRAALLYAHALTVFRSVYGELNPTTLRTLGNQVSFFRRQGDAVAARTATAAIVNLARRALAQDDLDPVLTNDLAYFAVSCDPPELRDPALAEALAERAVQATGGKWVDALSTLSQARDQSGDPVAAIAALKSAFENPESWLSGGLARRMHRLLDEHGAAGETDAFLARLASSRRTLYPADRNLEGETLLLLAMHDLDRGNAGTALPRLEAADRCLAPENPPTDARRVSIALAAADALAQLGRKAEARARLRELKSSLRTESEADPDDSAAVEKALAGLERPDPRVEGPATAAPASPSP